MKHNSIAYYLGASQTFVKTGDPNGMFGDWSHWATYESFVALATLAGLAVAGDVTAQEDLRKILEEAQKNAAECEKDWL